MRSLPKHWPPSGLCGARGRLASGTETTAHPPTWSRAQAPVTAKASDLQPVAGLHTPRCAVTQNTRTHTCRARTRPWQEAVTPDGTAVLSARQFYRGRYKRDFLKVATGTHRSHCAPGSAHTPCSPHDQHGADGSCAPVPSCSFVAPSSPVTDADPAAAPRPFPVGPRGRTRQARGFSPVLRPRRDCAGSALTGERPVAWLHRGRPLRLLVQCTGSSPLSVTAVASGGQRVEVGGGIQGARCSPHAGGRLGCHCCHRGLPPVPLQCLPALVASVA